MYIDQDVPIPVSEVYPVRSTLRRMKIKDSVFVAKPTKRARTYWHNSARFLKIKIIIRDIDGGIRIWRIA
jgi:hypothetical protein